MTGLPHQLRRRKAHRQPKRRFFLFCEGEKTEVIYFRALVKNHPETLVDFPLCGAAPITLAEAAVRKAKELGIAPKSRRRRSSFELADEVWVVFDIDEHPRIPESISICSSAKVRVARSNPCFEIWLILHEKEVHQPMRSAEAQRELRGLRPEYDPDKGKCPDCEALVKNVVAAEARAERLLARREEERSPYGSPSTEVHKLTAKISGRESTGSD